MPGQPNRRPGVPGKHLGRGVWAEVGDDWGPSVDPVELNRRLERRRRQVEKLKKDRSELRAALKLKTEEAFVEGQLSIAPQVVEVRKQLAETVARLVSKGALDADELKLLKVGLQQLDRWEDRTYGKTRQRQEISSTSASVDVNRLIEQAQRGGAGALPMGDVVDVADAEVVGDE